MIRLRPEGHRRLVPSAQVPNIAHGLRCDAKCVATLAAKVSRTSRSALASKIWIACTHIQAEYVCNVPECIASNQFRCRHRALCSIAHAVIHHTCSPLSVVAGLGARSLACAAMRGPARTLWAAQQGHGFLDLDREVYTCQTLVRSCVFQQVPLPWSSSRRSNYSTFMHLTGFGDFKKLRT